MKVEQRRWVLEWEKDEIFNLYNNNDIIGMCKRLLEQRMFSGGLTLSDNDSAVKLTPEMEKLFKNHWIPFAKDILHNLIMFGYSPYKITSSKVLDREGNKKDALIPVVPPHGMYSTELIMLEDFQQKMIFRKSGSLNIDYDVDTTTSPIPYVYTNLPALVSGKHISKMSTLLEKFRFISKMREYSIQCEHIRSNPTLFIQRGNHAKDLKQNIDHDDVADSDLFGSSEKIRFERMKSNLNNLNRTKEMAKEMNETSTQKFIWDNHAKKHVRLKNQYDNMMRLPDDATIAPNNTIPQSRTDLVEMERNFKDDVCGMFCIPKSLILHEGGTAKQNTSMACSTSMQMMQSAFQQLKHDLENILSDIYCEIYRDPDHKIHIDLEPFTSIETLQLLYDEGCIEAKTKAEQMILAAGLHPCHLKKTQVGKRILDPLPTDSTNTHQTLTSSNTSSKNSSPPPSKRIKTTKK